MSNKRRNRRTGKSSRHTAMGRARAKTRLAANVTEEHDWYLDTPDVRLTRIFTIVLLLHAVAFGGILAFKMVDKASETTGVTITTARAEPSESAVSKKTALAAQAPAREAEVVEDTAKPRPPAPLRRDRLSENQYRVQAGDTLSEIASDLGMSAEALRKANSIISDNELYPGRWLDLPSASDLAAVKAEKGQGAGDAVTAAPLGAANYTVVEGDTAWAIARKLNVSFRELMEINGIERPETLQIGQVLRIP